METNDGDRAAVEKHLAVLEPPAEWNPDVQAAFERFRTAPAAAHHSMPWRWAAMAAAIVVAAFITLPAGRAVAQRLWDLVTLNRLEVIRTEVDDLPDNVRDALRARITMSPGKPEPASTLAEASRRAGFEVRLPKANVLTGSPQLATLGSLSAELVLDVDALERAARTSGVDMPVPRAWNGARIAVNTGNLASAGWLDTDTTLIQTRPFGMSVPANVPLAAFTELALRILGIEAGQAKRLSERMAANPAFFFGISRDDRSEIREVSLRSGVGTLIRSLDENDGSVQRTELIWSTNDRVYALSGNLSDELTIAVANSIE